MTFFQIFFFRMADKNTLFQKYHTSDLQSYIPYSIESISTCTIDSMYSIRLGHDHIITHPTYRMSINTLNTHNPNTH